MTIYRTCCFIDYNPQENYLKLDDKNISFFDVKAKIESAIISLIEDFSVTNFISGMEFGLEQLSAEIVHELKPKFSGITLEGVIPYENRIINCPEFQRDKYYSIMQKIDKEVLLQYHYSYDFIRRRNYYMINKSKYIILYTNNASAIDNITAYARSKGRIVFISDVEQLNIIPKIKICK